MTVPRQYMLSGLGVFGQHSRLMEVHFMYRFSVVGLGVGMKLRRRWY
jgi:hypothetical protein